jgi:regulator of protease activity HflC (stomatin/prohibitin superfamily)
MVVLLLFAIPIILVFGGLGLALKSPNNLIMDKILFEFREYERAVVYRFGKLHRVVDPGWRVMIPIIDKFVRYDLRTEAVDIPPQEVITKDAVNLLIDAVVYIKVIDPVKAEIRVEQDYRKAVEEYVKGRIRNVVGSLELKELYAKISDINIEIRDEVRKMTADWGVDIVDTELIDVSPPEDVVTAMQAQEIAERYKDAAKEEAAATKIKIDAIKDAAGKLNEKALTYLYLESLKDVANGQASKIIFPLEFSRLAEGVGKGFSGGGGKLEQLAEKFLAKAK